MFANFGENVLSSCVQSTWSITLHADPGVKVDGSSIRLIPGKVFFIQCDWQ